MSADVRELLQQLANVDRRAAVWCACQCVREELRNVTGQEWRTLTVVETVESWTRGKATKDDCQRAASVARDAAEHVADPTVTHAACMLADPADALQSVNLIIESSEDSPYSILPELLEIVLTERWPLISPTPAQLIDASGAVAVAWDFVALADRTEHTIPELLEAHARAERLGFDWADPVQRAIAERATDEERIRQLLTAGPQGEPP